MKQFALLFICIFFFSCFKKEGFKSKSQEVVFYSFDAGKDMSKLFDFVVTYTDKNNKKINEQITSLPWNKEITVKTPFNAHFDVVFAAKNSFPDQERYDIGFNGAIKQSNISKSIVQTSKTKADNNKLRFSITLPSGISANNVNLSIAPLKYDKHFAFTFTVDDSSEKAWSRSL